MLQASSALLFSTIKRMPPKLCVRRGKLGHMLKCEAGCSMLRSGTQLGTLGGWGAWCPFSQARAF